MKRWILWGVMVILLFSATIIVMALFHVRAIWLLWGCVLFMITSIAFDVVYSFSVSKEYGWQSKQIEMILRNSNIFSPNDLNKFQLYLWRANLISRWISVGLGFFFMSIELVLFTLRS